MKISINSILDKIEGLLKGKRLSEALKELHSIDTGSMPNEYLAYYRLLLCEIKLKMGDYKIEKDLNLAVDYYR